MQISEARLAANRQNGARSQGPITAEGKSISRRNALKHGLTGAGVVVAEGDQDEIDRRIEALEADLKPMSEAGFILIGQMARLSIRAERAVDQESASIAMRVRHAADVFDEDQIEQAERLFKALPDDPRNNLRKLRKFPEGVARLFDEWHDLRADLGIEPSPEWTQDHLERAAHLLGLKSQHARSSRIGALSRAFWGDFAGLGQGEGGDLDPEFRKAWAKAELFEAIDAEIVALEAHYQTLDFATVELDRAEAGARSLFDDSKPATLARRYESEARRGFFKSLKEFRQMELEAATKAETAPTPPQAPQMPPPDPRMGSFRENPPTADREPVQAYPETPSQEDSIVPDTENRILAPKSPG